MNVAFAISAAPLAPALMTARNGRPVDEAADTGTPSTADQDRSLFQRFPVIAFSYEADASRLVMLYRDPDTGKTIEQIPSEAALKQYKEQQTKDRRKELSELRLLVGGADTGEGERFAPKAAGTSRGTSTSTTGTVGSETAFAAAAVAGASGRAGAGGGPQSGVNLLV